ncbi:MAG: M23 family metallopeptidase [Yaniella sp.]|uniref:M23 family metallopeptidase n=1 Tax=Yaniella sp. TaxID=2773929 RepID=UPI003F9B75B3
MRRSFILLYRVRGILLAATVAVLLGFSLFGSLLPDALSPFITQVAWWAIFGMVLGILLALTGPRFLHEAETTVVSSPVVGRWLALNSPATKTPSHGVRAYGQTYAIDLVYEPDGHERPRFGVGPAMRPPQQYPAFGEAVHSMVSGTVVRASAWHRDHRSRSKLLALIYMMFEGTIRELGGPGFILGNHVVVRSDEGLYAVTAHLQQGSTLVRSGETVAVGQLIGRCGNSGNSSEPHVHCHLMDRASLFRSIGLPMMFDSIVLDDQLNPVNALPKDGQHMTANR